jgi:hypothetical protein
MKEKTEAKIEKNKRNRGNGPSLLDEVLERRMLGYVLAAGAALTGAASAQAKVIFTPSNATIYSIYNDRLEIDLNNDGTIDVVIGATSAYCGRCGCLAFLGASAPGASNGLETIHNGGALVAFENGAEIPDVAANPAFTKQGSMAGMEIVNYSYCEVDSDGPFARTTNRFLGVKFIINGEIHYGWVGFRSASAGGAQLFGWAYETEPNKPIRTSLASASASAGASADGPTSLELLAGGHTTVADWRRRSAATAPTRPA